MSYEQHEKYKEWYDMLHTTNEKTGKPYTLSEVAKLYKVSKQAVSVVVGNVGTIYGRGYEKKVLIYTGECKRCGEEFECEVPYEREVAYCSDKCKRPLRYKLWEEHQIPLEKPISMFTDLDMSRYRHMLYLEHAEKRKTDARKKYRQKKG